MTLDVQKKNKKGLSNEEIHNGIIKKENGVNPFLTVMNFKISYKTWVKFARKKIRKIEKNRMIQSSIQDGLVGTIDASTSFYDDEHKPKIEEVEIEVEEFYSMTSEEDDTADVGPHMGEYRGSLSRQKSSVGGPSGSLSHQGSNSDLNQSMRKKKNQDHLLKFQRKMTSKFQNQMIINRVLSSSKKGVNIDLNTEEGHHFKNKLIRKMTSNTKGLNASVIFADTPTKKKQMD